jgi:RNA polymerase sigma factor FliA
MNSFTTTLSKLDNHAVPSFQISPRLINRKLNIIRHAVQVIEKQTGRVTNKAVAEYLGVSLDEYNHILQDANSYRLFHKQQEVA